MCVSPIDVVVLVFQITSSIGAGSGKSAIPKQAKAKNSMVGVQRRNTFGYADTSKGPATGPADQRPKAVTSAGTPNQDLRRCVHVLPVLHRVKMTRKKYFKELYVS